MSQLRSCISGRVILQWFFFISGIKPKLLSLHTRPFMNLLGLADMCTDPPSSLRFLGFMSVLLWHVLAPGFLSKRKHCYFL